MYDRTVEDVQEAPGKLEDATNLPPESTLLSSTVVTNSNVK